MRNWYAPGGKSSGSLRYGRNCQKRHVQNQRDTQKRPAHWDSAVYIKKGTYVQDSEWVSFVWEGGDGLKYVSKKENVFKKSTCV